MRLHMVIHPLFISLKQKISRDFICGIKDTRFYLFEDTQAITRHTPPLFVHRQTNCRSSHLCSEHCYKTSYVNFYSFNKYFNVT